MSLMDLAPINHTLATALSLGTVVLLSPEALILALFMAAHKTRARLNSGIFFLGSALGLFGALSFGFWITPAASSSAEHASWARFIIRASLGTALFVLGSYRAWQFLRKKDDRSEPPPKKPTHWKAKAIQLFPCLNLDANSVVNSYYLFSTLLIGIFTTGLHPKTSILAIAMGHQLSLTIDPKAKFWGVTLFSVLSLLTALFPLFLAYLHPAAGPKIKEKITDLLEVHGRWLAAFICFAFALLLWKDALSVMPR